MYWAHGSEQDILPLVVAVFVSRLRGDVAMKVLVVEAEEAALNNAGIMLKKLGYQVGLAPDCNEALRMYSDQGPFDLVLMALKFLTDSRGTGPKLIHELRQKRPEQKFAFMSSAPILKKPFSLQELDDFMGGFRRPAQSRFV
jgi:CheY-like chemotaxis protein